MMYGLGFGSGMGWGGGGGIVLTLIIVGLIVGVIFFVKRRTGDSWDNGLSDIEQNAIDILKTRYASGELTKEEYLKMKSDIEENN